MLEHFFTTSTSSERMRRDQLNLEGVVSSIRMVIVIFITIK